MRLDQYRQQIDLDTPYIFPEENSLSADEKNAILDSLLETLIQVEQLQPIERIPESYDQKRQLLRALLNIRPPEPIDQSFLDKIHRLLRDETRQKNRVDIPALNTVAELVPTTRIRQKEKLILWRGDITTLMTDAIVNAANNQLLGCFHPLHNCIDNIIHTAAGPMLRQDCKTIMDINQRPENTGDAKITRAYNLPSRFVLHTVGPIIQETPVPAVQREQLASCYRSCLDLADQLPDIRSVAFPCISTGVFKFPKDQAAEIAIQTVDQWLTDQPDHHFSHVVFNVFLQEDFDEYFSAFQRFGP